MRKTKLSLVILCAAAIGCSGSSGKKGENAARDLAQAVCDLTFGCCSRGEVDFFLGPYVEDEENCSERLINSATIASGIGLNLGAFAGVQLQLPNLAELRRAVKEGRTSVDGEALDACLEFLEGLGCNVPEEEDPEEGCVAPEPPEETPCQSELLFVGKVSDGGACSSPGQSFECEPGLVCRAFSALGAEGACVEPGDVGDLCFDDSECLDELYCSQLDGTCQVPQGQGESCRYADPDDPAPPSSTLLIECEEGLSCDPVTDTCVAPCERGAQCFIDTQCDETQELRCIEGRCDNPRPVGLPCQEEADCEEGLRCTVDPADPGRLICQEKLANDEPCSSLADGDEQCASGFCDPDTAQCAAAEEPGGLCPSAKDSQCAGGYCEQQVDTCSMDSECPGSGSCNQTFGRCDFYCVAARSDGSMCQRGAQCESEACIEGFCRTLPLADGEPCSSGAQCESGFCGGDFGERECKTTPLQNGEQCFSSSDCASGICFQGLCDGGLGEGDLCGQAGQPPCGRDLYCDQQAEMPECVSVREPGELCQLASECRGACLERFGRQLCDATPTEGAAVCDGD